MRQSSTKPSFDESKGSKTEPTAVVVPDIIEPITSAINRIDRPDWLIHKFIEIGSLGQIYSGWNVGKSALAVDIACRVATGTPFVGRRIKQGPVLYIASEGSRGLVRRFKGWTKQYERDLPASVYQTRISARLPDPETEINLRLALDHIRSTEDRPPHLVVIDTLAQTMVGDQNSTSDVDRFTALLRFLFPESAVMLLHHVGHGEKSRSRGASSLPAACDWEFQLEDIKVGSDNPDVIKHIRLKNTKQRDEEQQKDLFFSLVRVTLEIDEHGDHQTTVVPIALSDFVLKSRNGKNWGASAQQMLTILDKLKKKDAAKFKDQGLNPAWACVTVKNWRTECLNSGISSDNFRKTKQRLLNGGEIDVEKDSVTRSEAGQT